MIIVLNKIISLKYPLLLVALLLTLNAKYENIVGNTTLSITGSIDGTNACTMTTPERQSVDFGNGYNTPEPQPPGTSVISSVVDGSSPW